MSEHDPEDTLDPEAELRDALDRVGVPKARAGFRQGLMREFLAGAPGLVGDQEGGPRINALLDQVVPEPARAEFRAELRQRFLRGDRPQVRPRARRAAPRVARKQSWRWRFLAGGALAAAAALLLWLRPRGEIDSGWSVQSNLAALQDVVVDGERPSAPGPAALAQRLGTAHELRTGKQGLNLRFGDLLYIEIDPESVLDLSGMPAAGDQGDLALASTQGGFRLATGPDFGGGRRLVFDTPDVEASVVGTVFGVDVYPESGTCVCCTESEVLVRSKVPGQGEQSVPSNRTDFVHKDGTHEAIDIIDDHARPLRAMQVDW